MAMELPIPGLSAKHAADVGCCASAAMAGEAGMLGANMGFLR